MTSNEIRSAFLDFFRSKNHVIVDSAPLVVKNDPTLMFINSGMAPFKDIFLGNQPIKNARVADTQKCLRVSGKHNDLEEVGVDTYHHTMFEMLGNWSFGDYFKKEAIAWSWELLTEVYKIPKDRLYVTVFEGDAKENLAFDADSYNYWKQWIAEDRILKGNKKDNFWEMGEMGPCGPCSEIHVDIRDDDERKTVDGKTLVNESHPHVIEIWNNVFMEFNRKADGSLEKLPAQHVDTGMGFERLCMALQNVKSNYDTDVFQPMIQFISNHCGIKYGDNEKTDIAMRVMVDHIRAISFTIADGQLPANVKAGYVIRRILRRAVRYAFTFLNIKDAFMHKLVPVLALQFKDVFKELYAQQEFVMKVIMEEEISFLRTLETGIKKFEAYGNKKIEGSFAFELYDTYGFPKDLTDLMAREKNLEVDHDGFNICMAEQKTRSRNATAVDTDDWIILTDDDTVSFVGYDALTCDAEIIKYRKVKSKSKEQYHLVLNHTPFYAESGGQVGDTGTLTNGKETIHILDTKRENNLNIHVCDKIPALLEGTYKATVNNEKRKLTNSNHSATHLMHAALRNVLGTHVAQKGSLVNPEYTRFDFSHFQKVDEAELKRIEAEVNEQIRKNIPLNEQRNVPIQKATEMGAMALFGEKYGDFVRVITFDRNYSVELCGGTHVQATGEIGYFKIMSEGAVAAGVRRIEAVTSLGAEQVIAAENETLHQARILLKNPKDLVKSIQALIDDNAQMQSRIESMIMQKARAVKQDLLTHKISCNGFNLICSQVDIASAEAVKSISFEIKNQEPNIVALLATVVDDKPLLSLIISDNLVTDKNLNAATILRDLAKHIQGGGGGQPFYATAGGKLLQGLKDAVDAGLQYFKNI
ncbi:MAG: alanine--tRNA ligase [Bacteroidetes bacterium]|nr:alanine--tRNA ligase [Bacteroidota bacterium]